MFFFLNSCVKEVKLEFDGYEKKVVINSFFSPDSVFKVHLSYTAKPLDTAISIVENAKIELWSNNKKIDVLTYLSNGYYVSSIIAKNSIPYTIKVIVPNFDTIYATDTIPEDVLYQLEKNIIYSKIIGDYLYSTVFFNINDLIKRDYYELFFTIKLSDVFDNGFIIYKNFFKTQSNIITDELNFSFDNNTFTNVTFSDKYFNNTITNFVIDYESNKIYPSEIDTSMFVILQINKISNTYYKYKKSLTEIDFITSLPDYQNINQDFYVYTNIINGLGIFAGFNPKLDTLIYEGENYH